MKVILKFIAVAVIFISGCSSFVLKPVDFSWPVESVLTVDETGSVHDDRYSFTMYVIPLFIQERGDTQIFANEIVRIIRDSKGYYYLTSENFRNVFIFEMSGGVFTLVKKVHITDWGIKSPAFNLRPPFIQLLYGEGSTVNITHEGKVEEQE